MKRTFDIIVSITGIICLAPLYLLIFIIQKMSNKGPAIYKQKRIGKGGKPFDIYKFRTMGANSDSLREELKERNEDQGANFKMSDDPRVTRIGAFLRKYSIDELLQLFNILKSDMSIIGPRPFIAEEQVELPDDRLLVKPGLSCYWQIFGKNNLTKEEQIELDRKYIRERSVKTDIKILWKTVFCVIGAKNC